MKPKEKFNEQTVHFVWAGYEAIGDCFGRKSDDYRTEIVQIFYNVMIEHGIYKPFMITFLWRCRNKCVTKEVCDETYQSESEVSVGRDGSGENKLFNSPKLTKRIY